MVPDNYVPTTEKYILLVTSENPHEKMRRVLDRLQREGHQIFYEEQISRCLEIIFAGRIDGVVIPIGKSCGAKANALEEALAIEDIQIPIFEELLLTAEFNH